MRVSTTLPVLTLMCLGSALFPGKFNRRLQTLKQRDFLIDHNLIDSAGSLVQKSYTPPAPLEPENITTEYIELPLDHFDLDSSETFYNRYWVSDRAYKPGGPVFLIDGGEQNASDLVHSRLLNDSYPCKSISTARRPCVPCAKHYPCIPRRQDQGTFCP